MAQDFAYQRLRIHPKGTEAHQYWWEVSKRVNRVTFLGKPRSKAQKRRMRRAK